MKLFTADEVNALIPQLQELLDELLSLRLQLAERAKALTGVLEQAPRNGGNRKASEYAMLLQRFNAATDMISELGCVIKDLNTGLVDFPALYQGHIVYYCWQRGEARLGFWHELDSGFAGRQPL